MILKILELFGMILLFVLFLILCLIAGIGIVSGGNCKAPQKIPEGLERPDPPPPPPKI